MQNFRSIALLGAVLAASASFASATPFSGQLVLSGYGAYSQSGGIAALSSPNSGLNNYNFSSPSLGNFFPGAITFDAFSTASISSATPVTIFSILDGGDTLSFVATGFGPLGARLLVQQWLGRPDRVLPRFQRPIYQHSWNGGLLIEWVHYAGRVH